MALYWDYGGPLRDKQQDKPCGYCRICLAELYSYDNLEDELCERCEAELREKEEEEYL